MMKLGDKGTNVKNWQIFLLSKGFDVKADGYFGPNTERATKQFQISKGIESDGIVGESTKRFANANKETGRWPKQNYESMVEYYGPVGENQTSLVLPYKLKLAWDLNVSITKITCNEKVADSLYTIFEKTLNTYGHEDVSALKLDVFGGCLNVRKMRGGSSWSIHSWGAAVDLDPDRNQLRWNKDRASLAKKEYAPFWKIVEDEGWTSLGRNKNYDWMHFQAACL
jgi:hypothetical protein